MTKAQQVLDLIETDITTYLQGVGLGNKSAYWMDQIQGQDCTIALVIYNNEDDGSKKYSVKDIFTQALLTSLSKYIKPSTVKQIQSGELQFQPVSNKAIEADRVLVISSDGTIQFWGDFVK